MVSSLANDSPINTLKRWTKIKIITQNLSINSPGTVKEQGYLPYWQTQPIGKTATPLTISKHKWLIKIAPQTTTSQQKRSTRTKA